MFDKYNDYLPEFISIHALTRSATTANEAGSGFIQNFNPRTHEECDGGFLQDTN